MRWFHRRSSVELGTYKAPDPTEPPPVARIVEDGLLIAESFLVMTLRNQVLVDALRDKRDFDSESLSDTATKELEILSDSEWETAERLRSRREGSRVDDPWPEDAELIADRRIESQRREAVHRAMSEAFGARAVDRDILSALVERARIQAWDEVASIIVDRAIVDEPAQDGLYKSRRNERMAALVALDLSKLAVARGVTLS